MNYGECDVKRFLAVENLVTPSACHEWGKSRVVGGYGQFKVRGKMLKAHRFSYMVANGEFDWSLVVRHKCDNPPCVNPEHLELGTSSDNAWDRSRRGRTGWRKVTDEQVVEIRARLAAGERVGDIHQDYGVSKSLIQHIKDGIVRNGRTKSR